MIVVALHAGTFTGNRHHRRALARREIGAVKAVAGHQHHAADPAAGRSAARLGHALDREPRLFGDARSAFEIAHGGNVGVDQIEVGTVCCETGTIGEPCEKVVGSHPRHRDRAFGKCDRIGATDIVGRDHRLLLPDEHPQADIVAFRALGFLDRALADIDADGDRANGNCVGGIRPRFTRGADQAFGQTD